MKKAVSISFLFIYLVSALGIFFSVHFCCGKFAGIEFYDNSHKAHKSCTKDFPEKECCKTEIAFVKTTDSQKEVKVFNSVSPFISEVSVFSFGKPVFPASLSGYSSVTFARKVPVFLLNCVFRI